MPFKSEKQRRYLWATRPDIAKEWAHKYPESNKGLPMYANKDESSDSKEKAAQFDLLALIQPYVYKCNTITSTPVHIYGVNNAKSAADKLTYVDIPHSDKPTYAGQEREEGEVNTENNETPNIEHKKPENAINSLLQKLSVVLSQPMAQVLEDRKAIEEGRDPAYQPKNPGIRRYAAPVAAVPPPMGSPQAQAQQPAQPQPAQPAQQQGTGMNSPSANPIQSFGPLSASGNINGNAAFGQKNSPDSLKTAFSGNPVLAELMGINSAIMVPDPDDFDDEEYRMNIKTAVAIATNKWAANHTKTALDVERGGIGSRALASTLGHVGAFPLMTMLSHKSHVNPTQWQGASGSILDSKIAPDDMRAQKQIQLAKDMEAANPEELKDTQVYLGGPNLFKEYGRLFKNPRTSLLGKTMGIVGLPISSLLLNATRGSAFNPDTNSVYLMGDKPGVLSHELGHAIDFNSRPLSKTWLGRQGRGLMHDLYARSRGLPFVGGFAALGQEERANTLSRKNLETTYGNNPEALNKIMDDRQRILPGGIGSYVGGAVAGLAGPFGGVIQTPLAIGGALGGKLYGVAASRKRKGTYADNKLQDEDDDAPATIKMPERKEKKKDDERENAKTEKSKAAADWRAYKAALYRGLRDTPTDTGPDQIQDALFRFNQLRALARPSDNMLKGHGLSRSGFQHEMRRIVRNSQDKDRFELSKIAPNPGLRAGLTGAAGLLGTGLAAYAGGGTEALGVGLPATALAAGGAYLHGQHQRNNLKNTAKLLKNYGLLNPQTLRQAYPLIGDDYRLG
jgi:hypothetical protein